MSVDLERLRAAMDEWSDGSFDDQRAAADALLDSPTRWWCEAMDWLAPEPDCDGEQTVEAHANCSFVALVPVVEP